LNTETECIMLPPSTRVIVNIYTLQNSSQNWGLNAHMFFPDRWLRQSTSDEKSLNGAGVIGGNKVYDGYGNSMDALLFAPFSAGVRECMGTPMALWILRSVFFMMLQHFQFQFVDVEKFHDEYQVLTMRNRILLPVDDLPVMVSKKSASDLSE
jgi:cytochrome P450